MYTEMQHDVQHAYFTGHKVPCSVPPHACSLDRRYFRRLDSKHTQPIASILSSPERWGRTGVAQLFPEGTTLIVVQICWHQGEEGLGGQHDELALGARHRDSQAPGLQ